MLFCDGEGDGDVGTVLAKENARDGHVSHGHALVITLCISARQWIIEHAGRDMSPPKDVISRGTSRPEGATGAFACGQSGEWKVTEYEGKDVQLLKCFHEAENERAVMHRYNC